MASTQELFSLGEMGKNLQDHYLPQLKQNYESAKKLTEDLNIERKLNLKFLVGKQWVTWNKSLSAVQATHPMFDGGRVEPVVDNVVEPLTTQRVSFMASSTPSFESVSVTAQGQDMIGAAMTDRMFGVLWDKYTLGEFFSRGHYTDAARYNCFYHAYYDYSAGAVKQRGILDAATGEQKMAYRAEGDIQIIRVNHEDVYVDPRAERVMPHRTEFTDARYLFYIKTMDVGTLMNQPWKQQGVVEVKRGNEIRKILYGGLPDYESIHPTSTAAPSDGSVAAANALGIDTEEAAKGSSLYTNKERPGDTGKVIRVAFYYEHSDGNEQFPHGRFMAFLPDNEWWVLEYREELPEATEEYPDGMFLWVMSKDKEMTGRLAGECRLTQCRPLQMELNYAWTMWRVMRKNIKPFLMYDEDATVNLNGVLQSNYMTAVGYHSNAGMSGNVEPRVFWPPALQLEAGTAQIEAQFITRKIEDKIGIHNPANIPHKQGTTWSEINTILMRDLDAIRDNDVARHEATVYGPFISGMVELARRHFPEDRLLTFFGDKGRPAIVLFKKSQLNFSDVRIIKGTTMRRSKALQAELYMMAVKLGLLNDDDPARQRVMRAQALASMNLSVSIESSIDVLAMERAQEEGLMLLEGKDVPVSWHEPPAIHISEHWRNLNSADYYNLPDNEKPDALKATYAHCIGHMEVARLSRAQIPVELQGAILGLMAGQQQIPGSPEGASQPPLGEAAQPGVNQSGLPENTQVPDMSGQGEAAMPAPQAAPTPPFSETP